MLKSSASFLKRTSQAFFASASKQTVRLPSLKNKSKPSSTIASLQYDTVEQRSRMTQQEIASVREKRNKLIALEKRRAAINLAKYKNKELPQSTLQFKEKVSRILGSKCLNEAHLLQVLSSPKSGLIEQEVQQRTASKQRLKKIVEAHIKSRYTEEDRQQRPLLVRLEEEALDQLYQEEVYDTRDYDFGLEIEGAERYDLPEWKMV